MVPTIVIGTPMPAEVATARCIGWPYSVSTAFDTAPPLTPTSDDSRPVMKPKTASMPRPGNSVAEIPAIAAEQHLRADESGEDHEGDLEHGRPARSTR